MIENIITSRTKRRILNRVFESGDNGFYLRQLCREISEPPSAVNRELKKLEGIGFILPKKNGKTILYTGNKHHPLYYSLRDVFEHCSESNYKPIKETLIEDTTYTSPISTDVIMDED